MTTMACASPLPKRRPSLKRRPIVPGISGLVAGDERHDGAVGDLVVIPDSRHSLEAVDDSAVLLTVVVNTTVGST